MVHVLDWFRRLFGKRQPKETPPRQEASFDLLNQVAPLQTAIAGLGASSPIAAANRAAAAINSFVRRVPVLNRNEQIAGYAFNLHDKLQLRLQGEKDLLQKVYDDALLRNLTSLGVNSLLGHRLAFVRLSPVSLGNPLIQQLPTSNTVLMLAPARQALDPAQLQPQLDRFREMGIPYGWVLRKNRLAEHQALLPLAARGDYVQIESASFDGMDIKLLLKDLTARRKADQPKLSLIANELDTHDEFHLCFKGGFDFFSGRFVASREHWHPPKGDINRLHVIELLNALRGGEELKAIAQRLTHDPVMTFKLLRYINSPLMGLQSPIATMDKGLMVLGRDRFYRWLSLLLFDIKAPGYRERILTEQALTRACFLESLAGKGRIPAEKEQLFLLGLFSMLDLLMGDSIENIVQHTRLPAPIHQALLGQPGDYRDALLLAIAAEDPTSLKLEELAAKCGLDDAHVSRHAIAALTWAHEVMSITEG